MKILPYIVTLLVLILTPTDQITAQVPAKTDVLELNFPAETSQQQVLDGWIGLFDGKTTFGWTASNLQSWEANPKTGEIHNDGKGKTDLLRTTAQFDDFELHLEFKAGAKTNSGVFIRTNPKPKSAARDCYEINIAATGTHTDLSNWNTDQSMASKFTVTEAGELSVINGKGQLESKDKFANFVLSFQCKTNAPGLNSGMFFRCIPGDVMNGYESQIQNGVKNGDRSNPEDCGTGGIFRRVNARVVNANDQQWFATTIITTGPRIGVWVNGLQVTDWVDTTNSQSEDHKQFTMSNSLNLLLVSSSRVHGKGYLEQCRSAVADHFTGAENIVFVPFALQDHQRYESIVAPVFANVGLTIRSIHHASDPVKAIAEADGIFIGGGNSFRLLKTLYDLELISALQQAVQGRGVPYMGSSAGTNMACPTIRTTNDMPIVQPPSLEALGLIPFQINPHYIDADPNSTHQGETREQRLAEFHEENSLPVAGLREGSWLKVTGSSYELAGETGMRLFRQGQAPQEVQAGDVSDLLSV